MVINFKIRGINQGIYILARTPMIIIIKKKAGDQIELLLVEGQVF